MTNPMMKFQVGQLVKINSDESIPGRFTQKRSKNYCILQKKEDLEKPELDETGREIIKITGVKANDVMTVVDITEFFVPSSDSLRYDLKKETFFIVNHPTHGLLCGIADDFEPAFIEPQEK